MNFHLVLPVLLVLGIPAFAQSSSEQEEVRSAVRACRHDKVCLFNVVEKQIIYGMTTAELADPWVLIGILFGGIDAATQADSLAQKRDILDRAILLIDEYYNDAGGLAFPSSPLHLLRAEVCVKAADDACFLESAALLLEREIAWREERIKSAQYRAISRDDNMDYLLPPIKWSDIRDIRYDSSRTGGRKFGWGELEHYLNKGGSGNTDTRIDAILSDYERRTL